VIPGYQPVGLFIDPVARCDRDDFDQPTGTNAVHDAEATHSETPKAREIVLERLPGLLVPKLRLGNPVREAPASRLHYQTRITSIKPSCPA
jgi:hypothetical protein